ncbi:hypothetical protein [Lysobacter sp. CA199]|uniref:hypothetical protein n=1 Tax=Lysobacter sp. CA199 TaxID=3455608 RepID=UPI003F8D809C
MQANMNHPSVRGVVGTSACAAIAFVVASMPGAAWAMQKCPEEFGPKPAWFMALGLVVLILFALAGAALPWLALRLPKTLGVWRWVWFALALLIAMPAVWLTGLIVFYTQFALVC